MEWRKSTEMKLCILILSTLGLAAACGDSIYEYPGDYDSKSTSNSAVAPKNTVGVYVNRDIEYIYANGNGPYHRSSAENQSVQQPSPRPKMIQQ